MENGKECAGFDPSMLRSQQVLRTGTHWLAAPSERAHLNSSVRRLSAWAPMAAASSPLLMARERWVCSSRRQANTNCW